MDGGRSRSAFTLIELVTVLTLLAILATAVSGPVLTSMAGLRARHGAQRLAADLTYLQRYAMNTRRRGWAALDVSNNRYQLYAEDPANPGKANRQGLVHPFTQTSGAVQFGGGEFSGVSLLSVSINGADELEYDSRGRPFDESGVELPADATITLGGGIEITIRRVSGLVEVSD